MTSFAPTEPLAADNARQARRVVASQLSAWGLEHLTDDVELIVSELVTNAVRHAGGVRSITLKARENYVRIEVGDNDPKLPAMGRAQASDTGGRGLLLVDALSRDWGTYADETGGKVIWAELVTDPR